MIKEESAKDPLFKKIADHYLDFRKKYAIWGDAQFMKPTYHEAASCERVMTMRDVPACQRPGPGPVPGTAARAARCRMALLNNRAGRLGIGGIVAIAADPAARLRLAYVIATLPEHAREELLYMAQDYLPIVMFLTLGSPAVLRLSRGVHPRRRWR